MTTTTNVQQVKVNKVTQAQYDSMTKNDNEFYVIVDREYIDEITDADIINALGYTPYNGTTNPNGYTTNVGTVTGITMNGSSKGTSGVVDLGNVITEHQDISGKQDKITSTNKLSADLLSEGTTNKLVSASEKSTWNGKQNTITGAATTITSSNLTANKALISNSSGKVAASSVSSTELGYVSGVTSAIQTQLDNKVTKNSNITGATKCKITYDSKGLITSGADLQASDIPSLSLSKISDITASASELNILDGATLTTTELNYVDGVTSAIQTQLNNKASNEVQTIQTVTTVPATGTDAGVVPLSLTSSMYKLTPSSNPTISFNRANIKNTISSDNIYTFELCIDTTSAARTITFGNSTTGDKQTTITWQDGEAPDLSEAGVYFLAFRNIAGSSTWLGNLQGKWN